MTSRDARRVAGVGARRPHHRSGPGRGRRPRRRGRRGVASTGGRCPPSAWSGWRPARRCASTSRAEAASATRAQRDPQAVLRDVVDGYVSIDAAKEQYGVTIRQTRQARVLLPEDFEIQEEA